jgi:hypothetical protein
MPDVWQTMKCPECIAAGTPSRVYTDGCSRTLLAYRRYYDEDGVYHDHDPNTVTEYFYCSNKHVWQVKGKRPCPSCGAKA